MLLKSFVKHCFLFIALISIGFSARSQCASWANIGSAGFSAGTVNYTSVAVDLNGTPYVVYQDWANSNKATVMKYNGSSWVLVGSAGFSAGGASYTSIVIDANGTPYVAYQDNGNLNMATVMKYNGSAWVNVGSAAFSAGGVSDVSLTLDANGTPYVSYRDQANLSAIRATVMKYNGSSWVNVGSAAFSATDVLYTSIKIDGSGTPYVAYEENVSPSFKATVMKYNGSSWVTVGSSGFSPGQATFTSLAIDGSGTPYVCYKDYSNSQKISVMKYNGSTWANAGSAGFSSGQADYTSIAIDASGTPYVAYSDYNNGQKAVVQKYSGSSWSTVGTSGFSAAGLAFITLALDAGGTPYVVYQDYGNSVKATAQKYQTSVSLSLGGSPSICAGATSANLTYSATSGSPTQYSIVWSAAATSAGFSNVTNATLPSSPISLTVPGTAPAATYTGVISVTNGTCGSNNIPFSLILKPDTPNVLSIAGSNSVCAGASVTYTATVIISGASYQWKVNGSNVGSNSSTYSYTPSNSDVVKCISTSPAGCYITATDTSNSITVTVVSLTTPSLSINGTNSVCAGTAVTYTATSNVSGVSYQWKVNGTNAGTNSSTYTYSPANGDIIKCVSTMPAGCYSANTDTSNAIIMTVAIDTTLSLNITASANPVCSGTSVQFAATCNISNPSYHWLINGSVATSTNSVFFYIPSNSDVVRCTITVPSGGCYSANTDTSNTITMTVDTFVTSTISVSDSSINSCAGTPVTFTASTNISGGSYQWTVNSTIAGGNSDTFTYVPQNGDQVVCAVTAGATGCYNPSAINNPAISMNVAADTTPGITLSGPAIALVGSTVTINAAVSNAGTAYSIVWKNHGITFNTTTVPTVNYTKVAGIDSITAIITVTSPGCYKPDTSAVWVVQDSTTAVGTSPSLSKGEVTVFPNPFNEQLTVCGLQMGDKACMYDLQGRKMTAVREIQNNISGQNFSLSEIPAGIYFLHVWDNEGKTKANISVQKMK